MLYCNLYLKCRNQSITVLWTRTFCVYCNKKVIIWPKSHGSNKMHLLCWQLELAFRKPRGYHSVSSVGKSMHNIMYFWLCVRLFPLKAVTAAKTTNYYSNYVSIVHAYSPSCQAVPSFHSTLIYTVSSWKFPPPFCPLLWSKGRQGHFLISLLVLQVIVIKAVIIECGLC